MRRLPIFSILIGLFVSGGAGMVLLALARPVNSLKSRISTSLERNLCTITHPGAGPFGRLATNFRSSLVSTTTTSSFRFAKIGSHLSLSKGVLIQWTIVDPTILHQFPTDHTYVILNLLSSTGKNMGAIGDGYSLNSNSTNLQYFPFQNNLVIGARYKIQARLEYSPKPTGCAPSTPMTVGDCYPIYSNSDQVLINEATQYESESGLFTLED